KVAASSFEKSSSSSGRRFLRGHEMTSPFLPKIFSSVVWRYHASTPQSAATRCPSIVKCYRPLAVCGEKHLCDDTLRDQLFSDQHRQEFLLPETRYSRVPFPPTVQSHFPG